jgi:hypothetical protein
MKNAVILDVTSYCSFKNRLFEERIASIIKETRIGELGIILAVTSNRSTLRGNTMSVLARATRRNFSKDAIVRSLSVILYLNL